MKIDQKMKSAALVNACVSKLNTLLVNINANLVNAVCI